MESTRKNDNRININWFYDWGGFLGNHAPNI